MQKTLWRVPAVVFGSGVVVTLVQTVLIQAMVRRTMAQGVNEWTAEMGNFVSNIVCAVGVISLILGGFILLRHVMRRQIAASACIVAVFSLLMLVGEQLVQSEILPFGSLLYFAYNLLAAPISLISLMVRLCNVNVSVWISAPILLAIPFLLCFFGRRKPITPPDTGLDLP